MENAAILIKDTMSKFVVNEIKYHKIGDGDFWAQELFENNELIGYLDADMVETPKTGIYNYTVCDSDIERTFARKLEAIEDIKVFAKLPNWFKIPTPLGNYNPDWAILVKKEDNDKLYFVVETKGTDKIDNLANLEQMKIKCGKEHFAELNCDNFKFIAPVSNYDQFETIIES